MGFINQKNAIYPYAICVDFDGTLVYDGWPNAGRPYQEMFDLVKQYQNNGTKIILWTCRINEKLEEAIVLCRANGLEFDAINENLPEVITEFGGSSRKVYADEYWDDKAVLIHKGRKLN